MSFGGKSFKREKLRLRKELQELTKQSKNEFAILNTSDKSKLLESSSKTSLVQRAHPGHTRPAKKGTKIRQTAVTHTKITSNSDEEIPPPSPSIDLEAEIRKTPDVDAKTFQTDNQDLHRSTTAERKNSGLISRSTGVASIRSRKDLNVVMYGKGLSDENSTGVKPKISTVKSHSTQSISTKLSPRSPLPDEGPTKKPAIVGSQSTTVAVQLTSRTAPNPLRVSSIATLDAGSPRTSPSSLKDEELQASNVPMLLNDGNAGTAERDSDSGEEGVEEDESNTQEKTVTEESNKLNTRSFGSQEENKEFQSEEVQKDVALTAISSSALNTEKALETEQENEDESPVSRIHSQILELTRKISLPETGLLNLIRATEEAENEARRQREGAVASSLSKESIIRHALAGYGSSEVSVFEALKSAVHQDPKQSVLVLNPDVSKTSTIPSKTMVHGDEVVKTTSNEVDTGTRKDQVAVPLKSDSTMVDGNVQIPTAGELPKLEDKERTDARRSQETSDRDFLASQPFVQPRSQDRSSQKMTNEQALECMLLPPDVVPEDIISIQGQHVALESKQMIASVNSSEFLPQELEKQWIDLRQQGDVLFLDSWEVKDKEKENKVNKTHNIHHFCTMPSRVELPPHLCRKTRDEHTHDKFHKSDPKAIGGTSEFLEEIDVEEPRKESQAQSFKTDNDRRWSLVAQKILMDAVVAGDTDETLSRLKKASDNLVGCAGARESATAITLRGRRTPTRLPTHNPAMSLLVPSPTIAPIIEARDSVEFSAEEGVSLDVVGIKFQLKDDTSRLYWTPAPPKMHLVPATIKSQLFPEYEGALLLQESLGTELRTVTAGFDSDDDDDETEADVETRGDKARSRMLTRAHGSLSDLDKLKSEVKQAHEPQTDQVEGEASRRFVSVLDKRRQEIKQQDQSVRDMRSDEDGTEVVQKEPHQRLMVYRSVSHPLLSFSDEKALKLSAEYDVSMDEFYFVCVSYHVCFDVRQEREQQIREFLNQPGREITRQVSFDDLRSLQRKAGLQGRSSESSGSMVSRAASQPCVLDFDSMFKSDLHGSSAASFDQIRERVWYVWFDEVYPPTPAAPEIKFDFQNLSSPRPQTQSKSVKVAVTNDILEDIQVIEPQIRTSDPRLYEALQDEVDRLTELINTTSGNESVAIFLCRRGAVHRKLGLLKKAWNDLNRSIELEPKHLDAYWHRHLLYLLQENRKAALDDLSFIIKNSSTQARAFRSRAELYRLENDPTMAIVNYSQAIKLNPNDAETYYQRAAMFKMRGDLILALEDYKKAAELLPSKTDAMFEIGIFRFNNENWGTALKDFTAILEQDNEDSLAYTYRAKVHAKMNDFERALRDLAAAVHFNPNNAEAFYQRGCLLRKVHPRRALQDLSVSLILDNSEKNVKAFLHRGILYTDLKRWEDAIPDFEAALVLDPELASAHVNIGLIYIIKYNNFHKAVRRYTAAIRVDPTYIRAYLCRAEAYHKLKMLQEAMLDYTRVIHMRPDVADYHMARGKLLLEKNKLEFASFHVRQAADLNRGLGASATQQAVVQSFLKNYDQVLFACCLEFLDRVDIMSKVDAVMKPFAFHIDTLGSFVGTPWNIRMEMPIEAASVYFLIGMCHSELSKPLDALAAFNNAIRVNPDYAEAFYQRGLTKMKLNQAKGIHDFNRALAINPSLFQAFLSRAAYYGMKGRFSKGIMSCNEAIKLQPRSVRAYLYRGALKYNIKAYSLAVKDLTEAVAIDCKCSLAYFNRAVCYHEMRYFQKALMDYGTVMLLEEERNLKVLQNRGLLYYEIGDIENALQDFLAASKVSPNDPHIRHTLGLCYHRLNRLQESVSSYNDALRIDPFFVEAFNGRGNALMDFGHDDGTVLGRRDYLKALHLDPLCLSARVNLGYNLQVEGRFQAAWKLFSSAISIDSGDFMGDFVNAIRDYQAAVKIDPSYALAYYNAANVYFRQRQFKQALNYLNKALAWYADDESAVLNRAITKVMLKDTKGAIRDFNRAVELNPYAAHVYFNRANLYASLRKYKESEDDYTRALSLKPGDALVYKRRADVLGKLGKKEAAIQDYKRAIVIQTRRH
ncbi:PREDICTED: uncharacterized protein LOC107339154 [Acropora digitifera]|uniref:uncharacterized protein LOC107339154 n=1 Tax=Acropora digitifera TaxID=70779 RepID=UPI00077AA5D2|nr:PREDICTED: uncharacterized protein LOC107339154 [Acropora digitifera]